MIDEKILQTARSILFNTDMVRAILDERKTVTRRVLKYPFEIHSNGYITKPRGDERLCPYELPYERGDILYVRETWKYATVDPAGGGYALQDIFLYKADEPIDTTGMLVEPRWRPSIHMPRRAARIFLRVTDVWVERLQDITEEGVIEEGAEKLITCPNATTIYYPQGGMEPCFNINMCGKCDYIDRSYPELFGERVWDPTIKPGDRDKYGWAANPWVFVIEFERLNLPEVK